MTYTGCFVIITIVWCLISLVRAINRYTKIKTSFPCTPAADNAKTDIWFKPFRAFISSFMIWLFSLLFFALAGWNIPVETEIRTTINQDNQIVIFEEQIGNKYIVSINDTDYTCSKLVISDDIASIQVKFVELKTADHFYAKFFFDEMTGIDSFYELHIPKSYFGSS